MGWSLPEVPAKDKAPAWSPWVCLSIIFAGAFIALVRVVGRAPAGGLPALASGHWLPLTGYTLAGIMVAITLYLLRWEMRAFNSWNWNHWRRNMHLAWQRQAHQHLCVAGSVMLTADPRLLSRLAGGITEADEEAPVPQTLLPGEPLTPGISRFEQLCQRLITQIKPSLLQCYPSGELTVLVQTSAPDKNQESYWMSYAWNTQNLPWAADIQVLPNALSFKEWNRYLSSACAPILVLTLHYRQPEEKMPEFAGALLLVPPALLKAPEQRDAIRIFHAMPLNTSALARELAELRDMRQQPANIKYLVWHSGLSASSSQALGRVVHELPLPLYADIAAGGIVDFDKVSADYGLLTRWLMVGVAAEMAAYGLGSHWLLHSEDKQAWAMVLGNAPPVIHESAVIPPPAPYPAGTLMLALVLNITAFGFIGTIYPMWLFSWMGTVTLLLSLAVTLSGAVFLLRKIIAHLQRPQFIQAAGRSRKE
ncbi:hypothetical protein [Chimaeribacter arupi]|uniref:hypothetical protein n=1 Tax=Chimaeribacter arupi TaxID=2060066 RepID=UPI000C7C986E|nr:hypothetical protein [Chimaeribacter arupi]PLR39006.1 hypothetical protein CYR23_02855 [Chimaeribacter arupi]